MGKQQLCLQARRSPRKSGSRRSARAMARWRAQTAEHLGLGKQQLCLQARSLAAQVGLAPFGKSNGALARANR